MRYYEAWSSRFISVDPLTLTTPFINPYQYADCNPISNIDIMGLSTGKAPNISNGAGKSQSSAPSANVSGSAKGATSDGNISSKLSTGARAAGDASNSKNLSEQKSNINSSKLQDPSNQTNADKQKWKKSKEDFARSIYLFIENEVYIDSFDSYGDKKNAIGTTIASTFQCNQVSFAYLEMYGTLNDLDVTFKFNRGGADNYEEVELGRYHMPKPEMLGMHEGIHRLRAESLGSWYDLDINATSVPVDNAEPGDVIRYYNQSSTLGHAGLIAINENNDPVVIAASGSTGYYNRESWEGVNINFSFERMVLSGKSKKERKRISNLSIQAKTVLLVKAIKIYSTDHSYDEFDVLEMNVFRSRAR